MTKKITAGLADWVQQQMISLGVRQDCPMCGSKLHLDDQLTSILTEHFIAQDYLALVCLNCYHVMWFVAFPYLNGWQVDTSEQKEKEGAAGESSLPLP